MGFCMSLGMVCEKWGNHGVQSLDATWMQIHMHSTWMYEKHCCKKNHVGLGCVSNKTADLNGDFIGWKTGFVVCNSDGPLDGLLKMGWTFDGPLYDGYFTSMAREKCVSLSSLYEKHHPIIYDMIKIFTTRWTDYLQIKNHLYSLLVGACRMRHCCLVLDQPPATCSILNQRNCQSGSTLEVKRRFGGVFIYIYIYIYHVHIIFLLLSAGRGELQSYKNWPSQSQHFWRGGCWSSWKVCNLPWRGSVLDVRNVTNVRNVRNVTPFEDITSSTKTNWANRNSTVDQAEAGTGRSQDRGATWEE